MGKPTAFTEEAKRKFLAVVAVGGYDEDACAHAGFSVATLWRWRKLAQQGVEPQASFVAEVAALRAGKTAVSLSKIQSSDDWRAHDRWLQLTQPHKYQPTHTVVVKHAWEDSAKRVLEVAAEVLGIESEAFQELSARLQGPAPKEIVGEIVGEIRDELADVRAEERLERIAQRLNADTDE